MMQTQPHTGSYYAATVNEVTDFAPLRGDHTADACVIGAGFTGLSMALYLAERGYDVHVVEANRVGWGASGRNGGQVIAGIAGEKNIAKNLGRDVEDVFGELRWAGNDIIRERVETYGIQCDLKYGYLDVAIKEKHLRDQQADYERLRKVDFPYEFRLLSRDETRETIGTDAYIGALLNMGNGHVVIAGNAYHALERRLRGVMFPVRSYIIATEPLSDDIVNTINPQDLAVCDPNFVLQYFRLSADKRLLFGARMNYFGEDPDVIKASHRRRMSRIYPQLADIRIDYAWGGTIGVPLKRVPLLGRVSPDIYYCQGYSGHGVNVAHLAGRIMADAIAGTVEQFDMFANVKPTVVPGAHIFSKPMVALGVLYYQIKDRL
jgi:glycine/D-amino acid oxidase-like deaminating enzyme